MSLLAEALRTSIHILFPCLSGIGSLYGIGVSIVKDPLETVWNRALHFSTLVTQSLNSILFLTFWFFLELFVSTKYLILPCQTEINCTTLADCKGLSFFQSLGSCNVNHGTCHLIWNILTLQRKKLYAFIYFMDNTSFSLIVLR